MQTRKVNQLSVEIRNLGEPEVSYVSGELRYKPDDGLLILYTRDTSSVILLQEEARALLEQWNSLLELFPQCTEHGIPRTRLERMDGEMFRKPFFNMQLVSRQEREGYGYNAKTVHVWDVAVGDPQTPGNKGMRCCVSNSCASLLPWRTVDDLSDMQQIYMDFKRHQNTWTKPYDSHRGFLPSRVRPWEARAMLHTNGFRQRRWSF